MIKTHLLLPLFTKFVKHTASGKRITPSGKRINKLSVENYISCKNVLGKWESWRTTPLLLWELQGKNVREYRKVQRQYEAFYKELKRFLLNINGFSDNYTGQNIKLLKIFFRWVSERCYINVGDFYKKFYVLKEQIPIITLSIKRLRFLSIDKDFEQSLPKHLQLAKDVFVFGCMVGLRYGDLRLLKKWNVQERDGNSFLKTRSKKTQTDTSVKLSALSLAILTKYNGVVGGGFLLPTTALTYFNTNVKKIAELAGWVELVNNIRTKDGDVRKTALSNKCKRFCDMLSSHTMRRTCITTMLVSGMPEYSVRKISGHSAGSVEFFRYVSLAQDYMDKEIDKMHKIFS